MGRRQMRDDGEDFTKRQKGNLLHVNEDAWIFYQVEREEQLAFLHEEGCSEGQGYLFSKPIPRQDIEALLKASAGEPHTT